MYSVNIYHEVVFDCCSYALNMFKDFTDYLSSYYDDANAADYGLGYCGAREYVLDAGAETNKFHVN